MACSRASATIPHVQFELPKYRFQRTFLNSYLVDTSASIPMSGSIMIPASPALAVISDFHMPPLSSAVRSKDVTSKAAEAKVSTVAK